MTDLSREYRERRDPHVTPAASGMLAGPSKTSVFVAQQDDASSMHVDVCLEVDDVLVSWAVPKGPSTDPRDQRLTVQTDGHPLDYAVDESG